MAIILLNCFEQCENILYVYAFIHSFTIQTEAHTIRCRNKSSTERRERERKKSVFHAARVIAEQHIRSSRCSSRPKENPKLAAIMHCNGIYQLNQYFAFCCVFVRLLSQSLSLVERACSLAHKEWNYYINNNRSSSNNKNNNSKKNNKIGSMEEAGGIKQ